MCYLLSKLIRIEAHKIDLKTKQECETKNNLGSTTRQAGCWLGLQGQGVAFGPLLLSDPSHLASWIFLKSV